MYVGKSSIFCTNFSKKTLREDVVSQLSFSQTDAGNWRVFPVKQNQK